MGWRWLVWLAPLGAGLVTWLMLDPPPRVRQALAELFHQRFDEVQVLAVPALALLAGASLVLALRVRRHRVIVLGRYALDGDRLWVGNHDWIDLEQPYFAVFGRHRAHLLVRIAQQTRTVSLLLPAVEGGDPAIREPDDLTARRLRAYFPDLDRGPLLHHAPDPEALARELFEGLERNAARNSAVGVRELVPVPSRRPEPTITSARIIPWDPATRPIGGYRDARPTPADGAAFVAYLRDRAAAVSDDVHVDPDYLVWTRPDDAVIVPIGCAKAIASGADLCLVARGEDGAPLELTVPLPSYAVAHALAGDLDVAFDERNGGR